MGALLGILIMVFLIFIFTDTESLACSNVIALFFSTYVCALSSRKLFLIDSYNQDYVTMVVDEKVADYILFGASLLGVILQVKLIFKIIFKN